MIILLIGVLSALILLLFACVITSGNPGAKGGIFTVPWLNPATSPEPYSVYLTTEGGILRKIDPQTDRILTNVTLGSGSGAIVANPDDGRLYVCNGNNVTVIDTADDSIVKNLTFDMGACWAELSPDGSRLFVNYCGHDAPGNVAIVDTTNYEVIGTVYDVPFSWGMAVSPDGKYLYMSDYWDNRLTVIDTKKASIVKSISCGLAGGNAADVAVSPDGKTVYVSIWSANYLAIINTDTMSREDTVNMQGRSSSGVVVSPDGRYVYLSCCDANSLLIIDADTGRIEDRITVGKCPRHVMLTPDGRYLYILSEDAPIVKFDTQSRMIESRMGIRGSNAAFPAGQ
ncbi:YncE family protein [Methanocella sp. MCL-LM]|uniref:YncE family protein n=1 Tax=Methanocella sp. MCL-LM TaxID=3412035 RepID=UPI003C75BC06